MFGFFSKKAKARSLKMAKDAVSAAAKVLAYRRDLMPQADVEEFNALINRANEIIIAKEYDKEEFGEIESKLAALMGKHGGNIYPLKTITDYIETIVVAGVLALSVRSFFVTPFKIPTNSMYPSFYGMTYKIYNKGEAEPNIAEKTWNFVAKAASNYTLVAPKSGEVLIEINYKELEDKKFSLEIKSTPDNSSILGVWPTYNKKFTFFVDGEPVDISVPRDFSFEEMLFDSYALKDELKEKRKEINGRHYLSLGNTKAGDYILNFDILGGDMLFVDRFSYNFKKPQIGDSAVFLTKYCDGMTALNNGIVDDNYYIKRLVGQSGDTLEIKDYTLYRNGAPIEGNPAFNKNAKQEDSYCGYRALEALADGKVLSVPKNMYYMLGDNSANSLDSRYWGFVPEKAVIGKPLFVFYPFTR